MKKKKVLKDRRVRKSIKKNKKLFRKNSVHRKRKVIRQYKRKKIVRSHYKKRVSKVPIIVSPVILSVTPITPSLIKRGRRSRGTSVNKMYFTKDTEDSIIAYNNTTDSQIREDLYNTKIKHPFEKLVENIFNTFKFSYFEIGPLDVQKETVAHLVSNMHKFEAGKGNGIGKQLMVKALKWLGSNSKITLEVVVYNEKAINFYKKFVAQS